MKFAEGYTSMYGSWQPATVTAIAGSSSSERISLVLAVEQAASVLFNNTSVVNTKLGLILVE